MHSVLLYSVIFFSFVWFLSCLFQVVSHEGKYCSSEKKKKNQDISQNDAFAIKDVMHLPQVTSGSNKQSQCCCAALLWVTHAEGRLWPLATLHIFSIFNFFSHNTVIPCKLLCQGTNRYKQTKTHWQQKVSQSASGEKK